MENLLKKTILSLGKMYYRKARPDRRKNGYIAASGKVLGEEEMANMLEATLDMWLTAGRFHQQFEKEFAAYMGVPFALAVNSGSSANLLALSALTSPKLGDKRLLAGDEVITVAAGFPTTVAPIVQNGLIPVFADVDLNTCQLDVSQLEECLSPKTRAVFVAHTLGNVFDLDAVKAFCDKRGLYLIEDNCDALGSRYNEKLTGTFGHIGTFSFYPAHHMTMGEGGAVITSDPTLYRALLSLRDWGRDCWCAPGKDDSCKNRFNQQLGNLPFGYDHKYTYSHLGYNLKISDWQAACGLAQLKKLDGFIEKRKENFNKLHAGLKLFEKYLLLPKAQHGADPSWFGFLLTVKDGVDKIDLCKFLESRGVGTRQLFAGNLLRQPAFCDRSVSLRIRNSGLLDSAKLTEQEYALLPRTDDVMNRSFWIGVWPGLTERELVKVVETFGEYFKK